MKAEGWAFIAQSARPHYFRDGRSLCCEWAVWKPQFHEGNPQPGKDGKPFLGVFKVCAKCYAKRGRELKRQNVVNTAGTPLDSPT